MAIDLARGITATHEGFRTGAEAWGPGSNTGFFDFTGSHVGIVGLGDLGSALRRMLVPFRCTVKVFDPWLSSRRIREQDCTPVGIDELLSTCRVIFLFAGVTSENAHFIDAAKLSLIAPGSVVLLMSRANLVDFPALVAAIESGRVRAAVDVFPEEPIGKDHPIRRLPGVLLSSHRTGGMPSAFAEIGRLVADDVTLLLRGLPPQNCKRAERETVAKLRSRPISARM